MARREEDLFDITGLPFDGGGVNPQDIVKRMGDRLTELQSVANRGSKKDKNRCSTLKNMMDRLTKTNSSGKLVLDKDAYAEACKERRDYEIKRLNVTIGIERETNPSLSVSTAHIKSLASKTKLTQKTVKDEYVNQGFTVDDGIAFKPSFPKGFDGIIDAYLGEAPEKFTYNGKEYTPKSFAQELGIDADNYISLTSYTHHPFYTAFPIEVQDNWRWTNSYNLPIDELMQVFDNAINNGYTVAWASDVSEKGFTRNGIAVIPDIESMERSGSDQDHWLGLSQAEKNKEIQKMLESPCQEINVTQEMRQEAYDNYETTDDHGMLIYGIAKDQTGKKFYMVKNSWGTDSKYKGTWYASETFVKYKTMTIVVNKNALPAAIKTKLGIK